MNKKDELQLLAEKVGGWENLARGQYELFTTGSSATLKESLNLADLERLARQLAEPRKRGAKIKRDMKWFFKVEEILETEKANNPWNKERDVIAKHLGIIYGVKLRNNSSARDAAVKTVQNLLSEHRKSLKHIRSNYDPSQDPSTDFLATYEEPPSGFEGVDDPRLQD